MSKPVEKITALTVVLSSGNQSGGGYHQTLTNVRSLLKHSPQNFRITLLDARGTFQAAIAELRREGLLDGHDTATVPTVFSNFRDKVVADSRNLYKMARWMLELSGRHIGTSPLIRFLDTSDCDLVYFASPVPEAGELQIKPFVWTLWDLAHLDAPEFPEVRTSGKFEQREEANRRSLRKAALVVVDSQELAQKAQLYFGVPASKFVKIPFEPPQSFVSSSKKPSALPDELAKLKGKFFFYPAQLWLHKNHARVIQALSILVRRGHDVHALFAGADHGAGESIKELVTSLGLEDNVHFVGYVEDSLLPTLYQESLGLIMASYFGPTNIPPLEAMHLGTTVVASNLHKTQLGNGAIYFDPDDAEDLAVKMELILSGQEKKNLLKAGNQRLKELDTERKRGHQELVERLVVLSRRLA